MKPPLRILIVEDNPDDADLILAELRRAGFDTQSSTRVETEEAYLKELDAWPDIILSDYALPVFSGPEALELLDRRGLDIPFIIISGTIGEDVAVEMMKKGAVDYLLKDRLERLGLAVNHALEACVLRAERKHAAEELRTTHAQLQELLDHTPAVIYRLQIDGEKIIPRTVSENITAMLGFSAAETLSNEWWREQLHPEDRERALAILANTRANETSHTEYRLRHKDGSYRWVEDNNRLLRDSAGRPVEFVGLWTDITERKRAEEVLRGVAREEAGWRKRKPFMELALIGILAALVFLIADYTEVFLPLFRYFAEVDKRSADTYADDIGGTLIFLCIALAFFSYRRWRENKAEVISQTHISGALRKLHDEMEARVRQRTAELDLRNRELQAEINERRRAAEALGQSEERFRQLADNIDEVFWLMNPEKSEILYVSPAYEKIWGRRCADLYASPVAWMEAIHPGDRGRLHPPTAGNDAQDYDEEYRIIRPDGSICWIHDRAFPVRDASGKIHRIAGVARDITQDKQAADELFQSQSMLRGILDNIPQRVFWKDRNSTYLGCNRAFAKDAGLDDPAAIIGTNTQDAPWNEHAAAYRADDNLVMESGMPKLNYEEPLRDVKGRSIWLRTNKLPLRDKAGGVYGVLGTYEDITEQKLAAERIAEQAALLDQAHDAILVRDLEGRILFWSKGAERLYGFTGPEALGRKAGELLYGGKPAKYEQANKAVLAQGEWSGEIQQTVKAGHTVTVAARWTLMCDEQGNPKSILAINTDITEKKKIEAQFLRAQRMESIGTLASGIAHDLNNILAPIMMSIEMLKTTVDDPLSKNMLETLETCAQRGADIVRQVLSFGRGMEGHVVEIQPRHLLKDIESIIRETFPKNIELAFARARDVWTIRGDPTQLHQVLLNLCVNARDAMSQGGKLTIEVENRILDEQYAAANPQARTGNYAVISVTDTGTGIPQDILDKIFDPFFTTKEIGKGTGLGLSTVQGIVKAHDGFLHVYSEPGKGTTFRLHFPAIADQDTADQPDTQANLPRGHGETVLIVDDEASMLSIASQTLEAFNYRILTAGNGAEAIATYAEHDRDIALVLTDMMMPVMDGPAAIEVLFKMNPALKIIAASGLNANENVARATSAGVKHFLAKPYTAATLLIKIREVLDEGAAI